MLLLIVAGGLTWSVVQRFLGRFDKLAVMAPFPDMASDALTPATVIGKLNPATGEPFQPPTDSLIIDVRASTGCTRLALQHKAPSRWREGMQHTYIRLRVWSICRGPAVSSLQHPQTVIQHGLCASQLQGGLDVLALAFRITANIIKPLIALQPPPHFTTFQFPFGTHTGYQVPMCHC